MKKNKRAAKCLRISAAILAPALPVLGIAEVDPTPAPKPTPKPTPPDKALKFYKQPFPGFRSGSSNSKAALLEIRHSLSTRKDDLPEAVHATDTKTLPPLKPFAPKKAGGALPEWVNKFLKGRP